jgi:glycosyltransferase involved in cell wall biosynthesis
MNKKKNIQIFYGGFKFVKGGVNSHSISIKEELKENYNVTLITLDNLSIFVRFLPHLVERIVNFFFLPLGFYYKGICTRILFKFFFNNHCNYRIFEDIYISWNSNIPSLTMLHAVWSDNLQKYKIKNNIIEKLKKKEIKVINEINHSVCTVSDPYKKFIIHEHFSKKILKKISVIELGIKKFNKIPKKRLIPNSLIYVGSLETRKNIFFLFKLFNKLHKLDKNYKLTIIGDGPDKKELIKYKIENDLPIKFLGNKNQKEIFNELSKHEIYIHTSTKESFSLSLLEAKFSGLTTVAYKRLEVPKEFIDIGIDNFNLNNWFNKIIYRNTSKNNKINLEKFLLKNTAKKLIKKSNVYDLIDKNLITKLTLKQLQIVKKKFNLPNKFILNVCYSDNIKEENYLTLIKAIKILKKEKFNKKLFILIKNNKQINKIQKLVDDYQISTNIKILKNLNFFEIASLYKLTNLIVLAPSYKNDTGLILHSMASNIPMIISDTKFFREITKNKYVYFNNSDPLSLADKIQYVMLDKSIQKKMMNYSNG